MPRLVYVGPVAGLSGCEVVSVRPCRCVAGGHVVGLAGPLAVYRPRRRLEVVVIDEDGREVPLRHVSQSCVVSESAALVRRSS